MPQPRHLILNVSRFAPEQLRGVSFNHFNTPDWVFLWVKDAEPICEPVSGLSPTEREIIGAFCKARLFDREYPTLDTVKISRKKLEGSKVFTQRSVFTPRCWGTLRRHTSEGYEHLGDCWIVDFDKCAHWIPTNEIFYPPLQPVQLTIL